MPPRKKTKRANSPTPQDDAAQSSADTPSSDSAGKPDTDYDFISDPWTDEQETALLKAIIKWKPVGKFNCASHGRTPRLTVRSRRCTQTFSNARHFRLSQESRLCAINSGAYADSRNLEEARLPLQSGGSGRAGKSQHMLLAVDPIH